MKSTVCWLALGLIAAPALLPAFGQDASRPNVIDCNLVSIDEVPVTASDAGVLAEVLVKEGDSVTDQQIVARVDDREAVMARSVAMREYEAAKKKAENEINIEAAIKSQAVSKAELETAEETNRRQQGSFSETEVRRLRLTYERGGLQADLARFENFIAALEARAKYAQYEQADSMIKRRKLKAPHAGFVNEVVRRKGDWVNPGDPVVRLIRMDELRVQGRVSSRYYHWSDLKNKQVDIVVTLAGGRTANFTGTIGFASPSLEVDGSFRVWAQITNREENGAWLVGPGMKAEMNLR